LVSSQLPTPSCSELRLATVQPWKTVALALLPPLSGRPAPQLL
jgi:hypothetical protein